MGMESVAEPPSLLQNAEFESEEAPAMVEDGLVRGGMGVPENRLTA